EPVDPCLFRPAAPQELEVRIVEWNLAHEKTNAECPQDAQALRQRAHLQPLVERMIGAAAEAVETVDEPHPVDEPDVRRHLRPGVALDRREVAADREPRAPYAEARLPRLVTEDPIGRSEPAELFRRRREEQRIPIAEEERRPMHVPEVGNRDYAE